MDLNKIVKDLEQAKRLSDKWYKKKQDLQALLKKHCPHEHTTTTSYYDDGDYGYDRCAPSTTYTERCDLCGTKIKEWTENHYRHWYG